MYKNFSLALVTVMTFLTLAADALADPVVLFDESHAQQFLIGKNGPLDLSALAAACGENGFRVESSSTQLTRAFLSTADVLVISGPFRPFDMEEIQAILDFVASGGGLAVMLHIPHPAVDLLRRLDVDVANGTLHEDGAAIDGNPLYFKVNRLADHPLTTGLESFSVYGTWALRGAAGHVVTVAETGEHGWIDLDHDNRFSGADAMQPFAVVVAGQLGQGRYAVFGDDALFQNRFFDDDNRRLAVNLLNWLGGK